MIFDKLCLIKSISAVTNYNSSSCFFLKASLHDSYEMGQFGLLKQPMVLKFFKTLPPINIF